MQIFEQNLVAVRDQLAKGEIRAEEAVLSCAQRIEATESKVQALLAKDLDAALMQARNMDKEGPKKDQPLWGVPVTVKDALCTKGMVTTAGSRMLENFVPCYDAHVVQKLREAGAIILGKNNMDEFAMGSTTENSAYHSTTNPWDTNKVPGGSSGGSAASVAAGQCFASLGSDTGGSIRQPAALCGCVGIKPTYGRVSRYGLIAYGSSLDQVGPLARSVEDCALVLEAIAGHDERDSTSDPRSPRSDNGTGNRTGNGAQGVYTQALSQRKDLKGVRVGVPCEFFAEGLAPEVEKECKAALAHMQDLGAEVVDVTLPHTKASIAAYYIIAMAEASSNLARFDGVRYGYRAEKVQDLAELYIRSRSEGFGQEVQRRIMLGTYVLSSGYYDAYYRKAAQVRARIREDYVQALTKCDVICGPASPVTAWELSTLSTQKKDPLQMYLMDIYTLSLNLAGLPGLSLPVGLGAESRMPVGMQMLGRAFDEEGLLSIAHVLEGALPKLGMPAV